MNVKVTMLNMPWIYFTYGILLISHWSTK